jgi:hypothetical protein
VEYSATRPEPNEPQTIPRQSLALVGFAAGVITVPIILFVI